MSENCGVRLLNKLLVVSRSELKWSENTLQWWWCSSPSPALGFAPEVESTCSGLHGLNPSTKPIYLLKAGAWAGGYLGTQGWCALQGDKTPLRPCCVSKFEGVVVLGISDCCLHTELPAGRFTVWSWRKMPKLDFVCVCGQLHVLLFSICLCMACPMRCQIFGTAQSPSSFLSAEIPSSSQDALQQGIALKY